MPTAREMIRIVERAQHEATREIAAIWEPVADGGVGYEAPGSYMNRACGLGVDGPVTEADLDRVVAFFRAHGAVPRVEVSAYADPSVLEGLARRGFVLQHLGHVFARAIDADTQRAARPEHPLPEGVIISRLDPDDDVALRAYVDLSASGFLPAGAVLDDDFRSAGIKAARLPTADSFVVHAGDRLVGVAGMGVRRGMASLIGAVVDEAYRRRGVQQALIAARLERACERGATFATIGARPGIATERNAIRFGFRLLTSRVTLVLPTAAR